MFNGKNTSVLLPKLFLSALVLPAEQVYYCYWTPVAGLFRRGRLLFTDFLAVIGFRV